MKVFQKIIFWQFAVLLFLVPLILWPFTSEVFEFNKMVLVYILTTLITATWVIRMITEKKIIFRRTILDIPFLVFIGSQVISTILSIDPLTSLLGYYSRFNGGLVSVICYALLYWAFVSNLDRKSALRTLYSLLISASLISIYGVLEHFGIDKGIWQQDVQSRIFSTLGQPNWLAAFLIALIPITWSLLLDTKFDFKNYKTWIYFTLYILFFWTVIFTKSRSGYLGFAAAGIVFWLFTIWREWKNIKKLILPLIVICAGVVIPCLISGTEWTPSITDLINHKLPAAVSQPTGTTALETGGTESGEIRKIVWKGAIQVWEHYPIFGTGVETFAYSYYLYRPAEHNLTSEWDFIYNKAHNEYLNFAANSGTVGLLSYLVLIGFTIYQIYESTKLQKSNNKQLLNSNLENWDLFGTWNLGFAILAGYTSILVTNFFGFSVVPIQLEFFLFPAIVFATVKSEEEKVKNLEGLGSNQKIFICVILATAGYLVFLVYHYWDADYLYNLGKNYNVANRPDVATKYLTQAINLEPNQPLYESELATSYTDLALAFNQQKNSTEASELSNAGISEITNTVNLSPANVNFKRTEFGIFVMLSGINPNYLINARDTLIAAIAEAPTDAKLYYNLGLIYARIGQTNLAIQTLAKTVELKANYKEARLAYAILLIDEKQNAEAKIQLEYILTNIDPNDSLTKQTLAGIK